MAKSKSKPKAKPVKAQPRSVVVRNIRSRYDAATITDENRRHFSVAGSLSPDALATPEVRQRLRDWTRYEVRNNSWAKGIRDTLANDTVGTGPQLQMQTGFTDLDDAIETDFADWAKEIRLAEKLRTMRAARFDSGEVFGLLATNPNLSTDVKLDLRLVEAEQVTSTTGEFEDGITEADGIEYDSFGNPIAYNVLKVHPGSSTFSVFTLADSVRWPARSVLHYYRPDRPGQRRGIPDFAPGVLGIAELRRWRLATVRGAEAVADIALALETEGAPENSDIDTSAAEDGTLDTLSLARGLMTVLPKGSKLTQVKPEQPATGYAEFQNSQLSEMARCVHMPFTVAALDSSKSNLSAVYRDSEKYAAAIGIDRDDLNFHLDRILDSFLAEWILANRADFGDAIEAVARFFHTWFWPSLGNHADPAKVANSATLNLAAGLTNLPREYARQGLDWVSEMESGAKALGISVDEYQQLIIQKTFGPSTQPPNGASNDPTSEQTDETQPANAGHSRNGNGRRFQDA